jgi:hypothetical protein
MEIYFLIAGGVAFIGAAWWTVNYFEVNINDNRREHLRDTTRLEGRINYCEALSKICEQESAKQKNRIEELEKRIHEMVENERFIKAETDLHSLASEQDFLRNRIGDVVEESRKVLKEQEFMKAHQHGMDKRIAGLKREVIVTINEPPKKPATKQKVTKSLLKRAGVTQ